LQNNTFPRLFVGQNIVRLKRVDSTNNYLKDQLANSTPFPEGTVILAEEQYAGRGQVNNVWISEPGKNLTLSLLLLPRFLSPDKQFLLNQSISTAINDVLMEIIGVNAKIKWPNDIYFGNKKLGGILIENILRGSLVKSSVVGIGININQVDFKEVNSNATSLKEILHQDYDIGEFLQLLCTAVEKRYLQLRAGKFELIERDYLNALYRLNEIHTFKIDAQQVQGQIVGVNKNGLLEIYIGGKLRTYGFKEIEFVI
jgi:BirA family transcriptional regulator, biotin operon repressor / biotin---[acetyl-CoA-carboxylase] ligase